MPIAKKPFQLSATVENGVSIVNFNDTKIEFATNSDVVIYTNKPVHVKHIDASQTLKETLGSWGQIHIGVDFNSVAINYAKVEFTSDNSINVYTPTGKAQIKPPADR
jgi:hypothetical protein